MKTLFLALLLAFPAVAYARYPDPPKLILTIVVDQFRADYLTRFESRFLPPHGKNGSLGGYAYLMNEGAYYPFAEYGVFQNMTGPGHSMILSGSYPYQTGISINAWFDSTTKTPVYCVADPSEKIVGAELPGVSPKNFTGSTVGDELKNAGFDSKVVTVALKDRAAILLGGKRADLALWFDPGSQHWISSQYYLKELPSWVGTMNAALDAKKGETYEWKALGKPSGLTLPHPGQFGRTLTIGTKEALSSPYGLELTTRMAESALKNLKLGSHAAPDLLALSYSSHDYLGHLYGPNTLELEEMTVAEDRQISHLLNFVRKNVPGGLKNVVIVLTADHGVPPSATWLSSQGVEAGRIDAKEVSRRIEERLTDRFGSPGNENWVLFASDFNFYLNHKLLADKKLSIDAVESEARAAVLEIHGIAEVLTGADYRAGKLPVGLLGKQIRNGYYPGRSGDLVLVPKPFFMMADDPVTHHTGYSYDRTVPLILAGPHLRTGVHPEHAEVIDIAPTLSFLLGVIPPSLSEGRVLTESLSPIH